MRQPVANRPSVEFAISLLPTHPSFHAAYIEPALAVLSNYAGHKITEDELDLFLLSSGHLVFQARPSAPIFAFPHHEWGTCVTHDRRHDCDIDQKPHAATECGALKT